MSSTNHNAGTLYLVATPIGNLGDISFRAVEILKTVEAILAEDTRHSHILLQHYGISKPMYPYHDFNKEKVSDRYIALLQEGKSLALITDAGTPGISDPAFSIVRQAHFAKIPVVSIPGACAYITALVVSGLPAHPHTFMGFVPKKKSSWPVLMQSCIDITKSTYTDKHSFSMYMAPHQLVNFLTFLNAMMGGEFNLVLGRELTKKFEEVKNQTLANWLFEYREKKARGEFVLLFALGKTDSLLDNKDGVTSLAIEQLLNEIPDEVP